MFDMAPILLYHAWRRRRTFLLDSV